MASEDSEKGRIDDDNGEEETEERDYFTEIKDAIKAKDYKEAEYLALTSVVPILGKSFNSICELHDHVVEGIDESIQNVESAVDSHRGVTIVLMEEVVTSLVNSYTILSLSMHIMDGSEERLTPPASSDISDLIEKEVEVKGLEAEISQSVDHILSRSEEICKILIEVRNSFEYAIEGNEDGQDKFTLAMKNAHNELPQYLTSVRLAHRLLRGY